MTLARGLPWVLPGGDLELCHIWDPAYTILLHPLSHRADVHHDLKAFPTSTSSCSFTGFSPNKSFVHLIPSWHFLCGGPKLTKVVPGMIWRKLQGQEGLYSQGARWGSVYGKLLRRNIRSKEGFWLNWLDRILAEDRLGWSDITWRMVRNEEFDQIRRVEDSV